MTSVTAPPSPEVTYRPALPGEIPRGAALVVRRALANGFAVRTSYARGPSGKLNAMTDSILVRANHEDGRRAVASWLCATPPVFRFEFAYVISPHIQHANATHLRAYVGAAPLEGP